MRDYRMPFCVGVCHEIVIGHLQEGIHGGRFILLPICPSTDFG